MKRIIITSISALLISHSIMAQEEVGKLKKVQKDTVQKEIIIKDSWSTSKKDPNIKKNKSTQNKNTSSTKIGVGNAKLRIIENRDTTIIGLGNNELIISDDSYGNYDFDIKSKSNRRNFRGHWTGFELGVASFVEKSDNFMELSYPKSSAVNINLLQYNIPIASNRFGIVTGMGLSWYNFRFKNKVTLVEKTIDNKSYTTQVDIDERYTRNENIKKSKLTVSYLTIPILFELQSTNKKTYIAAGVIGGLKLGSHTKIKFSDGDKEKDFDDFYIRPYKADATIRLGLGICRVWGTYSLIPLFEKNKLYDSINKKYVTKTPIAIGLSFQIF